MTITESAAKHVGDIVRLAIKHPADRKILVVFDERVPLAKIITEAYRAAIADVRCESAQFLDFDAVSTDGFFVALGALSAGDLVVLVQSSSFRLDAFRIRIELFKRGLATIEHLHLERSSDDRQIAIYVDALAYDPAYYLGHGHALKAKIDAASRTVVRCAGTELVYEGGMEPAKLNVGDYTGMKNTGGTFPIGEVFSEPRVLARVNGEAMLFAFADTDHLVRSYEPFKVSIKDGILTALPGAPAEFHKVLAMIGAEEDILVREFGLGLNPAMGPDRMLSDITAFERQKGLHLSLGEKHGVYKKPGFNPKKTHYHIDVFVAVERIEMDGIAIYENDAFILG